MELEEIMTEMLHVFKFAIEINQLHIFNQYKIRLQQYLIIEYIKRTKHENYHISM